MNSTHRHMRGKLTAFSGVVATLLVAGIALAPAAFAHHADITGTTSCAGLVTFTSTSWAAPTAPERSNPSIQIAYSTDSGTTFIALPQKTTYRFDSADNFQFTDTFTPPAGWTSLVLRAASLGTWGDGAAPGDSRTSAAITPTTGCVSAAAATIADASCSSGGSLVHLSNPGASPVDFTITGGTAPQTVNVAAGASKDVTVAVPADTTSTITVAAPAMTTVTRQVTYHCASTTPTTTAPTTPTTPSGSTAAIDTTATGALVHLGNPGSAPVVFTIVVPGSPNSATTVPAGGTADVPVTVAAGTTRTVTVQSPGMPDVQRNITVAAASAPVVRTAPVAAAAPARALPRTGLTTTLLVFVGLAFLASGSALVLAGRRKLVQ